MAEDIISSVSAKVEKLISMYEQERSRSASLEFQLEASRSQICHYKEKQTVLENKIKTLVSVFWLWLALSVR